MDGGAFCSSKTRRFGNYIFSHNLIKALQDFDKKNNYFIYSFCNKPQWFVEEKNINYKKIGPKFFWSKLAVGLEEIKNKKDIYLALNQSIPFFTKSKTISFSHGLSFLYLSKLYPDSYSIMKKQLDDMVKKSSELIVSSIKVKQELLDFYPKAKNIHVINFGVPFDMLEYKKVRKEKYFLFVGMNHPVKNIKFIVDTFQTFINNKEFMDYKLYLIGDFGEYKKNKKIKVIDDYITREKLKEYYSGAVGYLTASLYESFNLPVLESLACGTRVIGLEPAIIPELKQYATVCKNTQKFIDGMKYICSNPVFKKRTEIINMFSWKKYVDSLVKLYD